MQGMVVRPWLLWLWWWFCCCCCCLLLLLFLLLLLLWWLMMFVFFVFFFFFFFFFFFCFHCLLSSFLSRATPLIMKTTCSFKTVVFCGMFNQPRRGHALRVMTSHSTPVQTTRKCKQAWNKQKFNLAKFKVGRLGLFLCQTSCEHVPAGKAKKSAQNAKVRRRTPWNHGSNSDGCECSRV